MVNPRCIAYTQSKCPSAPARSSSLSSIHAATCTTRSFCYRISAVVRACIYMHIAVFFLTERLKPQSRSLNAQVPHPSLSYPPLHNPRFCIYSHVHVSGINLCIAATQKSFLPFFFRQKVKVKTIIHNSFFFVTILRAGRTFRSINARSFVRS